MGKLIHRRAWLKQIDVSVVGIRAPESACEDAEAHDAEDYEHSDHHAGAELHQLLAGQPADTGDVSFHSATALSSAPAAAPLVPLWCVSWAPSLLDLASCSFNHPFAPPTTFLLDVTACIALVSAISADDKLLHLPSSSFSIEFNRWQQCDERCVLADSGARCVPLFLTFSLDLTINSNRSLARVCVIAFIIPWQHSLVDHAAACER